jgi:RecA/RadA recombinase
MVKEETKLSKDIMAAMDEINTINPYATYLNESTLSEVNNWIDTGSLVLNALISGSLYGGIPDGRVCQLAAPSMCGKSFIAQRIAANAQKAGKTVVIFDSENAIDSEGAKKLGLDTSKVKYVPSFSIEQTRNAIYKFLTSVKEKGLEGKFIIIIDSLANLQSELELKRLDKESTSADMGTFAKAIKSLLKTCTNLSTITKTPILITNHVYDDPSAMYPSLEKNMAGGKAAIYLPSVTVQLARKPMNTSIDAGKTFDGKLAASQKNFSGIVLRALTVKNRFIQQYLEGEMYLSFSTGLDRYYGLLEIMKGMGVVSNAGATYHDWSGEKLGYYTKWRKDVDLWENRLLPELENRIKANWSYGNGNDTEDEIFEDDSEDDETSVEKPLNKLKKLKSKVTEKLDQYEEVLPEEDQSLFISH